MNPSRVYTFVIPAHLWNRAWIESNRTSDYDVAVLFETSGAFCFGIAKFNSLIGFVVNFYMSIYSYMCCKWVIIYNTCEFIHITIKRRIKLYQHSKMRWHTPVVSWNDNHIIFHGTSKPTMFINFLLNEYIGSILTHYNSFLPCTKRDCTRKKETSFSSNFQAPLTTSFNLYL